ncbi:hypothetical protein CYMTET_17970 [Cymbomonas tetramitiformis]|uniref:Uncharacterized protein n=1 Tax=Cymbomonas tetramitiformis TaxID=36881 RepID=A0AAE0G927_9CHLO|nr:hypothetical protein CYMTET_17970 [Cymbomonas tetramitiformis]
MEVQSVLDVWTKYVGTQRIDSPLPKVTDITDNRFHDQLVNSADGDKTGLYLQYHKKGGPVHPVVMIIQNSEDLKKYETEEFTTDHLKALNMFKCCVGTELDTRPGQKWATFALGFAIKDGVVTRRSCLNVHSFDTDDRTLDDQLYFELVEHILGHPCRVRCEPQDLARAEQYKIFHWAPLTKRVEELQSQLQACSPDQVKQLTTQLAEKRKRHAEEHEAEKRQFDQKLLKKDQEHKAEKRQFEQKLLKMEQEHKAEKRQFEQKLLKMEQARWPSGPHRNQARLYRLA